MPWAAIAGAVAGAVANKALGSSGQTSTTTKVNYKRIVSQAKKTGFNPLTLLRNGGASNATTISGPVLSSTQWLADAVGMSANALASYDPNAEAEKQLQADLVKAQINNLNASTIGLQKAQTFANTKATFPAATRVAAGPVLAGSDPLIKSPATITNPFPRDANGVPIGKVNPYLADAEMLETRYGELGGSVLGVGNIAGDVLYNTEPVKPVGDLDAWGNPVKLSTAKEKPWYLRNFQEQKLVTGSFVRQIQMGTAPSFPTSNPHLKAWGF